MDLIDRQAAINAVLRAEALVRAYGYRYAADALRELPSVQPKRTEKRTETHACDCISREAAIERLKKHRKVFCKNHMEFTILSDKDKARVDEIDNAIATLVNLPSAQPHITHCAECIHWQHSAVRKSYCEVFDWMNRADDFCSFAERRTDE